MGVSLRQRSEHTMCSSKPEYHPTLTIVENDVECLQVTENTIFIRKTALGKVCRMPVPCVPVRFPAQLRVRWGLGVG